jgi:hypothetical protein
LTVPPWAAGEARRLPYPLAFATVSGAHLYGFASADSDLDLRAAHLLPVEELAGLRLGPEAAQHTGYRDGVELDVVSHDLRKFAKLLASPNGYARTAAPLGHRFRCPSRSPRCPPGRSLTAAAQDLGTALRRN